MSDQQDRKVLHVVPEDVTLKCKEGCYFWRWNTTRSLIHLLSRRKLVIAIEQCIARLYASDIELRFMSTGKVYEPGWCWEDVDARIVSLFLEADSSGEEPKRYCTRNLERQRQLHLFLSMTNSKFWNIAEKLRQAHGHPGPEIKNFKWDCSISQEHVIAELKSDKHLPQTDWRIYGKTGREFSKQR